VGWRRRLAAVFTERLALKASSVLLAIVTWFLVAAREPMEEVAPVRFSPQLDSGLVLRDPTPAIRALVIGRANEILKLGNTPLTIRRRVAGDSPDTLVINLRTSDVEIPEGVEVIVRDVQPRAITLRFEPTSSRVVPVRADIMVRGDPDSPAGAAARTYVRLEPESVTVLGPRLIVNRIPFVTTVRDSLTFDSLPHLVDVDTSGLGVEIRPPQVKAFLFRRPPPFPPS
jgi:hypothetical protein